MSCILFGERDHLSIKIKIKIKKRHWYISYSLLEPTTLILVYCLLEEREWETPNKSTKSPSILMLELHLNSKMLKSIGFPFMYINYLLKLFLVWLAFSIWSNIQKSKKCFQENDWRPNKLSLYFRKKLTEVLRVLV